MAAFSFNIAPLMQVSKDIQRIGENVKKAEAPIVKLIGNEYKSDVQEIIQYKTGTLRRDIHVEMSEEGGHPVALVGTNQPQARRLEKGFIGRDSLGRLYNQAPAPRWRPAFDHNLAKYERMAKGVFNREEWDQDVATFESIRPDLASRGA